MYDADAHWRQHWMTRAAARLDRGAGDRQVIAATCAVSDHTGLVLL